MSRRLNIRRPGLRGTPERRGGEAPLFAFGDGTFARASAATWWSGTSLTRYSTGVLRRSGSLVGRPAYYIEGARTNEIAESSGNTGWAGAGGGVLTASQYTNPAGDALGAPKLDTQGGTGSDRSQEDVALADSTNYLATMFAARQGTAWVNDGPVIQLRDKAGGTTTVSGATDLNDAGAGVWTRAAGAVWNSSVGATTPEFRCRNNQAEVRLISFWGAQLEAAEFASQHIETSGGSATRVADDLSIAMPAFLGTTLESFTITIEPEFSSTQHAAHGGPTYICAGGAGYDITIDTAERFRIRFGATNVATSSVCTWDAFQQITLSFNVATDTWTVAGCTTGDGDTVVGGTGSELWGGATLYVGQSNSKTDHFFGRMTEFYAL